MPLGKGILAFGVLAGVDALWPKQNLRDFNPDDLGQPCPRVPERLVFNYKSNLLTEQKRTPEDGDLAQNVRRTIKFFPRMNEVEFADNTKCAELIEEAHSEELAGMFNREKQGRYKSDLCRLAQLYLHGGYYFDNDLEPIADFHALVPKCAGLVTVKSAQSGIFQAFLGAVAGHPVLQLAMNMTLQHYKGQRQVTGTLGTAVMEQALHEFAVRPGASGDEVFLLEERFPEHGRFRDDWKDCNFGVWHENEMLFFSRVIGSSWRRPCRHSEYWSWHLPSFLRTRFRERLDLFQDYFFRGSAFI